MRDWLRRLIYRDPILRVRCAWHVLQGKPLAYRLESEPTLVSLADNTWLVQVTVRWPRTYSPDAGIYAGGHNVSVIQSRCIGDRSYQQDWRGDPVGIISEWDDESTH